MLAFRFTLVVMLTGLFCGLAAAQSDLPAVLKNRPPTATNTGQGVGAQAVGGSTLSVSVSTGGGGELESFSSGRESSMSDCVGMPPHAPARTSSASVAPGNLMVILDMLLGWSRNITRNSFETISSPPASRDGDAPLWAGRPRLR